jgi:FkbM family methyltransferase
MVTDNKAIDFNRRRVFRFNNSERDESRWVHEFFGNRPNGFFVDVGANDPVRNSQSYPLERFGWNGILIEPLPDQVSLLREKRSATVVECAVSSRENHGRFVNLLQAGSHSTLCGTLAARKSQKITSQAPLGVFCQTLDSVLEDATVPANFEFLSIDVEGHELEVLDGFSISKWRPQLVLLEDHGISLGVHNFMRSRGYALLLRTGLNSWYVPELLFFSFTPFARWQYIRKTYLGILPRRLKRWLSGC